MLHQTITPRAFDAIVGQLDAAAGHSNSRASYMRHGDPEPVGMHWYLKGRAA